MISHHYMIAIIMNTNFFTGEFLDKPRIDNVLQGIPLPNNERLPVPIWLIALFNLTVLGFSFVFHDKAKRTQQGNLITNDLK